MAINSIETEIDYKQALNRLNDIFDASPDTLDGDKANLFISGITDYEVNITRLNPKLFGISILF